MLTLPVCFGRYQRGDKACDGRASGALPCLERDRCVALGIHLEDNKLDRGDVLYISDGSSKEHSLIREPGLAEELRRLVVKHRIRDGRMRRVQASPVERKKEAGELVNLFFKQLAATTGRKIVAGGVKAEAGDLFTKQRVGYIAVYGRPNHFDQVYVCAVYPKYRSGEVTVRIAAPFKDWIFGAKNITGKDGKLCIEFSNCDAKRSFAAAKAIGFFVRSRTIDLGGR